MSQDSDKTLLGPIHPVIPEGDNRQRMVCVDCGFIHYENPKIVVGAIITCGERYLLCKRAIAPRIGFWTMPAGYMERDETTEEGAARETREEACAEIVIDALLGVYSVPTISQVQLIYRATLVGENYAAGPESTDVGLFEWHEIPWQELAFPTVQWALNHHRQVMGLPNFAPFTSPEGHSASLERFAQEQSKA